jgi:hypothetical protein
MESDQQNFHIAKKELTLKSYMSRKTVLNYNEI